MSSKVMGDDALMQKALSDLHDAWAATADAWRDEARTGFQASFIEPLDDRARQAAKAINFLESLLAEANRQCQ